MEYSNTRNNGSHPPTKLGGTIETEFGSLRICGTRNTEAGS